MQIAAPIIAVLDDEPEMRKALRRLLTCRGCLVEEYEDGEALFSALDSHSLDCLLLDLHMPKMNGFEVLETLRSFQVTLPVIVFTAHDEPGTAERVRDLGASAYLKKPVDKLTLMEAIEHLGLLKGEDPGSTLPVGTPPAERLPSALPRLPNP
jgi:CheY-like chemotaxis protein